MGSGGGSQARAQVLAVYRNQRVAHSLNSHRASYEIPMMDTDTHPSDK